MMVGMGQSCGASRTGGRVYRFSPSSERRLRIFVSGWWAERERSPRLWRKVMRQLPRTGCGARGSLCGRGSGRLEADATGKRTTRLRAWRGSKRIWATPLPLMCCRAHRCRRDQTALWHSRRCRARRALASPPALFGVHRRDNKGEGVLHTGIGHSTRKIASDMCMEAGSRAPNLLDWGRRDHPPLLL